MEEWFHKQREKYGLGPLGVVLTFFSFIFIGSTFVTIISDLGFSTEVTEHRWRIILAVAFIAAFLASIWWGLSIRHAYNKLRRLNEDNKNELHKISSENGVLRLSLQQRDEKIEILERSKYANEQTIQSQSLTLADLEKQKQSLFQLMQKHQEQAKENVIVKLRRFAIISVQQQQWSQFSPHVMSFRIEPKPIIGLTFEQEVSDRVTVNINLGMQHRVMAGMVFQIRDPVDSALYGIVVVKEAHSNGSTCEIIDIEHQAFWADALTAIKDDQPKIIDAPKNELVPQNAIEIEPNVAEELLRMLDSIRTPTLGD